jgi:capsular exopolysaccharide synthesis family protein
VGTHYVSEADGLEPSRSGLGLRQYLEVIRRRKWIVLGLTVIAVGVALAISLSQKKTYEATTKIVVGQGNSLFQPGEANAVQPFTATMGDLVRSNIVATMVIRHLGLSVTPEKLLSHTSVSINPSTAVVKISVTNHDKALATREAQEIGTVFSGLVRKRFGTTVLPATRGTPAQLPLTATVFDPAHPLPGPVSPKPVRDAVIAFVLGLILGLLAAFLREHFDRGLRTREAVEASFGVPVIGQVPFARGRHAGRPVVAGGFSELDEAFRALRANLQYLAVQRPLRTILVTSAAPQQGKTTVAANLALTLARSGASTVAVEADLRRPRLDEVLEARAAGSGLTGLLVGQGDVGTAIVNVAVGPGGGRLAFLPSGPLPPNPTELLSSGQMQTLLDRLSVAYDHVVIDSPPILLVADALELARQVDGVILVVRRNHSTTDEAREVRALVERLGIHLVGVVFTDVRTAARYGYGTYGQDAERTAPAEQPAAAPPAAHEREQLEF